MLGVLTTLMGVLAAVFVYAMLLIALDAVWQTPAEVRWSGLVVVIIGAALFSWGARAHRGFFWGVTVLLAGPLAVLVVFFGPLYLTLFMVILAANAAWLMIRGIASDERFTGNAFESPDAAALTALLLLALTYSLLWVSGRDLRLDTVQNPAVPGGRAGLLSVDGDTDVLVVCSPSPRSGDRPTLRRVARNPRNDVVSAQAYRVPVRATTTLLDFLNDSTPADTTIKPARCGPE